MLLTYLGELKFFKFLFFGLACRRRRSRDMYHRPIDTIWTLKASLGAASKSLNETEESSKSPKLWPEKIFTAQTFSVKALNTQCVHFLAFVSLERNSNDRRFDALKTV
jgi:hypothetical protein